MGETPTTVNKPLGVVESIINAVVMKASVPAAVGLITTVPALSWLKIWPLSYFLKLFVSWLFKFVSVTFQYLGVKLVLTIQTDAELSAVEKAEGELRAALLTEDKDAIKAKSDEFDKAYAALIHYDGSSAVIK